MVSMKVTIVCGSIWLWHQHRNVLPDHFRWKKAEHFLKSAIHMQHQPLGVDGHNGIDSRVQNRG